VIWIINILGGRNVYMLASCLHSRLILWRIFFHRNKYTAFVKQKSVRNGWKFKSFGNPSGFTETNLGAWKIHGRPDSCKHTYRRADTASFIPWRSQDRAWNHYWHPRSIMHMFCCAWCSFVIAWPDRQYSQLLIGPSVITFVQLDTNGPTIC
jgi:hypothetical protein